MKKINAAVVGSGFGDYVIIKALKKFSNIEVNHLFSRNKQKLKKIALRENIPNFYSNYKKINCINADLLCIATTPYNQYKILKNLKNKKIKYLFIEKPPSHDLKSFIELYKKFKKKKIFKKILVDFIFLKLEPFLKFKEFVSKKKIIKVNVKWHFKAYHFKNKINTWKTDIKHGGGIYYFYLIHVISYINFFFGTIDKIKSKKEKKNKHIYGCQIELQLKNGIKVSLDFNSNSNKSRNIHSINVLTKKSSLLLRNTSKDFVNGFKISTKNNNKKKPRLLKFKIINIKNQDNRILPVYLFVQELIKNRRNYPNFVDALKAMKDIDKCVKF